MITRTSFCLANIVLLLSTMAWLCVNACRRYRSTGSSLAPIEREDAMSFRRGSWGALRLLVSSTLLSLSPMALFAQSDWPSRPVTIIVGYSAGSAADIVARTLANPLAHKLGQSVVVENRSGADAMIAGRAVARAEPTCYTVGFGSPTSWALTLN